MCHHMFAEMHQPAEAAKLSLPEHTVKQACIASAISDILKVVASLYGCGSIHIDPDDKSSHLLLISSMSICASKHVLRSSLWLL